MTHEDIHILGQTDGGKILLGGFFTAHDTHGYHCDWFMPLFLQQDFAISTPYFAAECWQHENRNPDMIWPMLEIGYREARMPFDVQRQKERFASFMAWKWEAMGKPPLRELALAVMQEQRDNGRAFIVHSVRERLRAAAEAIMQLGEKES